MSQKHSVVIVAGGIGKRMGSNTPKQYMLLAGKPIIIHTLEKFIRWDREIELVVVVSKTMKDYFKEITKEWLPQAKIKITSGGKERFHSVKNGLAHCTGEIIGIHDAVRPLVSMETIKNCYAFAAKKGNAVPALAISESIRKMESSDSVPIDRTNMFLVQTPQVFKRKIINKAFETPFQEKFTDDASVVEFAGHSINLVEGNRENVKITRPEDLKFSELVIANQL